MPCLRALLLSTTFACGLAAQQKPPSALLTDPDQQVAACRERVRAEVATLGAEHAWAGSYYRGDGTGVNIAVDLAPKAGFAFTWNGCLGVYDRNYGSVAEKDGRLELTFRLPAQRQGRPGLGTSLLPVAWGERHYLVAVDAMKEFANEVNCGSEPRRGVHGMTLLRRGDEGKPVQGQPTLPKEFAALLLGKPLEGLLVAVRDSKLEKGEILSTLRTTAVVDRGTQHGVWQGMRLYWTGERRSSATVVVTKVEAQTAQVEIADTLGDKAEVPVAGWAWSTRASWAR